jgi:hypothetical protein
MSDLCQTPVPGGVCGHEPGCHLGGIDSPYGACTEVDCLCPRYTPPTAAACPDPAGEQERIAIPDRPAWVRCSVCNARMPELDFADHSCDWGLGKHLSAPRADTQRFQCETELGCSAQCQHADYIIELERQLRETEADRDYEWDRKQVQMAGRVAAERQRDALLEVVRDVAGDSEWDDARQCQHCYGWEQRDGHRSDCRWLAARAAIALCEKGEEVES